MKKEDLVSKKIKSVELKTKKLVSALNLGDYKSVMKGQGMTFSDFREYVPGDDVRNISWSLIAKTNKPFVKQFEEERELCVYFLMDTSFSMFFGTKKLIKAELAMYLIATLAMAAQKNNDLSGLVLFSKSMELFVKPKKGQSHVRRLITEILKAKPSDSSSDGLSEACNLILEHQKKKSVVFIFSDFLSTAGNKRALQALSKKHQIIACVLKDSSEEPEDFDSLAAIKWQSDFESIVINSKWVQLKTVWRDFMTKLQTKRQSILNSGSIDKIDFFTDGDFYKPLLMYFKRKSKS